MRFKVDASELSASLQKIKKVLLPNPIIEVIGGIHVTVLNGIATFRATDMQSTFSCRVAVDTGEDYSFVVPGSLFISTIRELKDKVIDILYDENKKKVYVSYGKEKYVFSTYDELNFPREVDVLSEGSEVARIPSDILFSILDRVSRCVTNDELRPEISGVYIEVTRKKVMFVSSDNARLCVCEHVFSNPLSTDVSYSFVFPQRGIAVLQSMCNKKEDISFNRDKKTISFWKGDEYTDNTLRSLEVNAEYPNFYDKLVEPSKSYDKRLFVDTKEAHNIFKKLYGFSSIDSRFFTLDIGGGVMKVLSENKEMGHSATSEIGIDYNGDSTSVCFNAGYLKDIFKFLSGVGKTKMSFSELNKPFVFSTEEEGFACEVFMMPIYKV